MISHLYPKYIPFYTNYIPDDIPVISLINGFVADLKVGVRHHLEPAIASILRTDRLPFPDYLAQLGRLLAPGSERFGCR